LQLTLGGNGLSGKSTALYIQKGSNICLRINVPAVSTSMLLSIFISPKDPTPSRQFNLSCREKVRRLDLIGAILLSSGLIFLVYALQIFSTSDSFGLKETVYAALGGSLLALFILHEIFVNSYIGLIPRTILAIKEVWISCVGLFFLFAGFINYTFFLSMFFQVSATASP
jgi:hypothetical protein